MDTTGTLDPDDLYNGPFTTKAFLNGSSRDMNVDGSGTPVDFTVVPTSSKMFYIARMVIFLEDQSINFNKFGGRAALPNGIDIEIKEGGATRDPLNGESIKENLDMMAYDADIYSAASDLLIAKIEFLRAGTVIRLEDAESDYVTITVNDDLTTLDSFYIITYGYEVDE